MYKAIKVDITEKQANQALHGKSVRFSAAQIGRGNTFLRLHPANAKAVEKAALKKTGVTLHLSPGELAETAMQMGGAGFWSNIWKGIKSVWKVLKDSGAASALADAAVAPLSAVTGQPALVGAARAALKNTTGVGIPRSRMSKADKYAALKGAGIYLS
jgi:hypothetical protein